MIISQVRLLLVMSQLVLVNENYHANPIEIAGEQFCNDYTQFSDNEIMDMGILSEIVACLACPECKHVGIEYCMRKDLVLPQNARCYVEIVRMKKFRVLTKS